MTTPFLSYVRSRWLIVVVVCYAGIGLLLKAFGVVNILPPCLWTAIFHHHCPGCGITTATTLLLQGRWAESWHTNPLAIPAVIIITAAIVRDYVMFTRRQPNPQKVNEIDRPTPFQTKETG